VLALSLLVLLISPSFFRGSTADSTTAYAKVGAYAFYSGTGGFIAFMSGVSANITYTVTDVYPNNTMRLQINSNLSLGTEVSTAPTVTNESLTDSISRPKVLPVMPAQDLNGSKILFQNVSLNFVGNSNLPVPAGRFNATEYEGKNANGTVLQFWFDRATGLALQEVEAASYFQLVETNIATPLSTPTALQSETPFIVVFFVGWAGAGLLFYAVYRHYTKKPSHSPLGKKSER
jgi:hypothetical protein